MKRTDILLLIGGLTIITLIGFGSVMWITKTNQEHSGASSNISSQNGSSGTDQSNETSSSPASSASSATNIFASQATPIIVTFVSHNEEPGQYPNFTTDQAAFTSYRSGLLSFVNMIKEEGLTSAYDWQTDYNFALGIAQYDKGTAETNNQNIAKYISSLGIEVDPHSHIRSYNYADDAYLISQLGVTPSNIAGGFIITPTASSQLELFWKTITGAKYPNFSWTASATWGGGSAGHTNDADASGVWRPQDKENFLTPVENGSVINIGPYTGTFDGVLDLLNKQKAGQLQPGKIYTATIMANQIDMQTAGYAETYRNYIEQLKPYAAEGRIVFANLNTVVKLWQEQYQSVPNVYNGSTNTTSSTSTSKTSTFTPATSGKALCGDGVCNAFERSSGMCAKDCQ